MTIRSRNSHRVAQAALATLLVAGGVLGTTLPANATLAWAPHHIVCAAGKAWQLKLVTSADTDATHQVPVGFGTSLYNVANNPIYLTQPSHVYYFNGSQSTYWVKLASTYNSTIVSWTESCVNYQ